MTTESLRDLLAQLQTELAGSNAIAPERRAALVDLRNDLERLIAGEVQPAELSPEQQQHLQGRLQAAAVSLETSHPQLFGAFEQALNVLSNMGL